MDLNNLKPVLANEGAVMQVIDPDTEEPIEGMTITLLGQDSDLYEKLSLKRSQAALNRMSKGKKVVDMDAEKLQDAILEDTVALTVDWTGFELNGKELKPTPDNIRKVYKGWKFIKEQAQEFVAERSNFFRKPE